ncbi:MAG: NAD-binding protein [Candidatus Marinimicrobia bacterium]|jgi:voltage-gated potassium channel|nr:NAD-binding protein [Candidatus Neomarinimicrobiota bacterium]MDP6966510.1 NAD-binding protein [Candidatus Neomarinimicrobiota bacterium]|tara:strand:- start:268 stop:1266 length:999 start_codon:yes stop_codon:yes gene_type:complete
MGFSKLGRIVILVLGTVLLGAAGFKVLGGKEWSLLDALYMAVITLSTVGFEEVHTLSDIQKIWTIVIISFGIGIVFYAFSQAAQFLLSFDLLRRRRMENKASHLKDHFIVCGYGRMGKVICGELIKQGQPFVIIENNMEKITKIAEESYIYVQGDATLDETLQKAGIQYAKGLVVVLNNDSDNLFVTMSARTLNPELFITSRCSVDSNAIKLHRAGADKAVNPYVAGGHRMAELLVAPYLEDSVEIRTPARNVDIGIEELKLDRIRRFDGITIKDAHLREEYGLLIVGIIGADDEVTLNPDPKSILRHSDTVMILGEKDKLRKFEEAEVEVD